MIEVRSFAYGEHEVRATLHKGEPWWVLRDVRYILDLPNIHQVIEHIEEDDLTYTEVTIDEKKKKFYFVNESGLYAVLAQADKEQAKPFKKWVVNEMLPKFQEMLENSKEDTTKQISDNAIQILTFDDSVIRTVIVDEELYWVGKDVCRVLGFANPNDAISKHCKGVAKCYPLMTKGGIQEFRIIPESDVLRLIVSSRLPTAVKFERWVFEEVLPSIRKTGSYMSHEEIGNFLTDPNTIIHIATQWKIEMEKRIAAEKKIEEDKPKVDYFDDLIDRQNNLNFRDTAKELGVPERKFIDWLLDEGFVYRDGKKQLKPYSDAINTGLFVLKEWVHGDMTGIQTLITVQGRDRFHRLLKPKNNTMTSKLDKLK